MTRENLEPARLGCADI